MRRTLWMAALVAGAGGCLAGCSQRLAGGETSGTETGNARVSGILVDTLGRGVEGARIAAYPVDHDPLLDEEVAGRAVTDSSGRYVLRLDSAGPYNILGVEPGGGMRTFAAGIHALPGPRMIGDSTARVDTLRPAGSGILPLPQGFAGSGDHLYVAGTPFLILGSALPAGTSFAVLDSLPAGNLPEIRLRAGGEARAIAPEGALSAEPGMTRTASILPPGWQGHSVGETMRGGGGGTTGIFHLTGGGPDIWGLRDGCYFVHQEREGDFVLTARVTFLERTSTWSKATLMMRATLDPESPAVALSFLMGYRQDPSIDQAVMHIRRRIGDTSEQVLPGIREYPGPPAWLRLVREGTRMTSLVSDDGKTWEPLSTAEISMPARVFVGLAQTSHTPVRLGKAIFEDVSLTPP